MKKNNFTKTTFINIIVVFSIVISSVIYSQGGGNKYINVFLNAQREIPIYSVETKENKIALTFDAASGKDYTNEIIDILDKNNIKATFFVVGGWVDKYPERLNKLLVKKHEIGNHSNTHPYFTQISKSKAISEITLTWNKIEKLTGINTSLFRVPYGDYNSNVINTVNNIKNICIQWDVDSIDWKRAKDDVSKFIEDQINDKLELHSDEIEDIDFFICIDSVAKAVQPVTDQILKDL